MYVGMYVGMGRGIEKLTQLEIDKATRTVGDGKGLWLQVGPSGGKSWLFRYTIAGKAKNIGLGSLHSTSAKAARKKAAEYRKQIAEGADPAIQRKLDAARDKTFSDCAAAFIQAHRAGWKNAKHAGQWETTLATYAAPVVGAVPVAKITKEHVLAVLEPIWYTKAETASRVQKRIEKVLAWAIAREYRAGENPARWRDNLDKLLPPSRKVAPVAHHPALPFRAAPSFLAALRKQPGIAARALEFATVTAARSGEVRGATWGEIDTEQALWVIPAERMKASKEHVVPLSPAALSLLQSLPRIVGSDHIFPSTKGGRLSDMAMTSVIRRMNAGTEPLWVDCAGKPIVAHGLRSTFRDWVGETTSFPREVIEHALAHQLKDRVEAAYSRGTALAKRRELMREWAIYLTSHEAKVIPLARAS